MTPREIVAGPEITELAGQTADPRQLLRQLARYRWAARYCAGRDVAEIACGTGQGLGLIADLAHVIVGADHSWENIAVARQTYGGRIPLLRLNAEQLPFPAASLDVIILLEALYFLPSAPDFMSEARRCLKPGGYLLISVINRDTADYNPRSIYHAHYGVRELVRLVEGHGFSPSVFGSIPLKLSVRERMLRPFKRAAVRLGIVPTPGASAWLKRVAFGHLERLPFDFRADTRPAPPAIPIDPDSVDRMHQAVLCAAKRR